MKIVSELPESVCLDMTVLYTVFCDGYEFVHRLLITFERTIHFWYLLDCNARDDALPHIHILM